MGSKIGNNNPTQSLESLAHAFQGVLDALGTDADPKAENYLVGKKIKDESEIDGAARGEMTYLSPKSKKHGAASATYRLSGRRKDDYKQARIYLEELASRARERSVFASKQYLAVQDIEVVLATSKSKGYINISAIKDSLEIIIKDVETTAQNSAEAVMKDFAGVDGTLSHFLDDVEAIRTRSKSQEARKNISKQGDKNVALSKEIENINKQAGKLKGELPDTLSQLKLKRRSFTTSSSSTAGEVTGEDLLDKLATWPGPDLRRKAASLFDCAKPEDGGEYFKQASKEVLLALAEQESILNLISNEFLNTIQSGKDRGKLQSLCNSAEVLLFAFRAPDSPFTRLRNLALAGYYWPTDTASKLAGKRAELLNKVPTGLPPPLPVNVQPGAGNGQPPANAPRIPGNVPGNSQGLRPLPAIPGAVLPVSGSVPSPSNSAQPAANVVPSALPSLPSIPNGPPPPLPGGKLQPATVNGMAVGTPPDDMPAPPPEVFNVPAASMAAPTSVGVATTQLSPIGAGPLVSGPLQPNIPSIPNDLPPPLPGGKLQPATVNGVAVGTPPDDMPAPPPEVFNVPAASMPAPTSGGVATTKLSSIGAGPLVSGPLQPNIPSIPNDLPPPLPGGKLQPATVNGVAVGSPPDDMPAPPAALFIPPPPDDTPPPPSNAGQAAQPANNVMAVGAQPQSAISNVTPPSGLQPNASSSPQAKPAIAGTFVKKRVNQILGESPLMPTEPALSLSPSVKASPDMLPPANVDADADMSVPPPDYMPPPPRQDQEASGQLNPVEKAAAAAPSAALDVTPPPEEPPPPLPSNLPPPVLNGVLVPLKDVAPGGVGKAEPVDSRAKAAIDELFAASNVPPAPGIQSFPTTAAKLLADLTSSDQTYLTASKDDDGTGHRVVTKKGKVLFLKASSTQEEVGLRSLVNNRLLGRRDAQTKKALAALLEDAELGGFTLTEDGDPGHAAPMIKHALELGKHGVKFDDFARRHVTTILTEYVKRQKAVVDRVSTLLDQSKKPSPLKFEAAVEAFLIANGSGLKKNGEEHFLRKLLAATGSKKSVIPPLDEFALPSDRRNHELIKAVNQGVVLTDEVTVQLFLEKPELDRIFKDATSSFVAERMQDDANIFPPKMNVFDEIVNLVPSFILGKSEALLVNLFNSLKDVNTFKKAAKEVYVTFETQFNRLELAGRLFANERYLEQVVPVKQRSLIRRYGEALRNIALVMLDPEGGYMSLFRMTQAAEGAPEFARSHLVKVLSAIGGEEPSDSVQLGESKPSAKPLPPIPTGVPLDRELGPPPAVQPPLPAQKLGPPPAVQPPLPTFVASASPQANAAQATSP